MADRWGLDPRLAEALMKMSERLRPISLTISSGYRNREHQDALGDAGRPTADHDKSTHRTMPATGADLEIGATGVDPAVRIAFGNAAVLSGLRWGGGSPMDATGVIPTDWKHVDLGRRTDGGENTCG